MTDEQSPRSRLDFALNLFTEVRGGESLKVLLLALNVFLLMTSYYIIKPVREALILAGGGAEAKSYLAAAIAVVLVFFVPAYARLVDRFGRDRLIALVTTFFIGCLVVFWVLGRGEVPMLGYAFFIWVGIFNVVIIAQFWSFANDVYDNETGKRLFPIVAAGASIGAVAGSSVEHLLLDLVSVFETLLVSAGLLGLCILLSRAVSRISPGAGAVDEPIARRAAGWKDMGFDLLFKHRYLGFIALLVLLLNLVNTTGEYLLGALAQEHGHEQMLEAVTAAEAAGEPLVFGQREIGPPGDEGAQQSYQESVIGAFYGTFFFWVNLLGVVFQLFLVGRLVKYGGIKAALFMLPIIAFGTYALIVIAPVLTYARWAKTAENATDYSVNNTVRQMLFLPTSREIKYKAKQAIDSFMHRAGDVASAGVVFLGNNVLALSIRGFATLNLGFVVVWLTLAGAIVRRHAQIEAGEVPEITGEMPAGAEPAA